jgi:hypothetical protein
MDTYETDRDTLEDVLYRHLEMLWAPFTDALKVFQRCNASQPLRAQKSVLLATFRASPNASLRAAYHTVLDALDDGEKDLTFALIQDHCAREIRSSTREPDRRGPARGDDRSFVRPQTGTPRRAAVQRHQDFSHHRPGDISAFLCNILEANNVKPKRVLKAKNIPHHDLQDAHTIQALFEAALPYMPETVASDTDASGTDPSLIDSQASDASDD